MRSKRPTRLLSLLPLAVALGAVLPGVGHGEEALEPMDIAIGEWRPFVSRQADGYGPIPELVTEVLARIGYRPRYVFMPWGQVEEIVARNEQQTGPRAMLPFRPSDARARRFVISKEPLFSSCYDIFYHRGKVPKPRALRAVEDIDGLTLGYVAETAGYQYPEALEPILRKHGKETAGLYEAFEKLVDDDDPVEAVPAESEVGRTLLRELFPEERFEIGILPEEPSRRSDRKPCSNSSPPPAGTRRCLLEVDYFFMASLRNPHNVELMRRFDEAYGSLDRETRERALQRARERPTALRPGVRIDAAETATIPARDGAGPVTLPRGSRGLLLDWSAGAGQDEACVRIISGPHRGKEVLLDRRYVTLE